MNKLEEFKNTLASIEESVKEYADLPPKELLEYLGALESYKLQLIEEYSNVIAERLTVPQEVNEKYDLLLGNINYFINMCTFSL